MLPLLLQLLLSVLLVELLLLDYDFVSSFVEELLQQPHSELLLLLLRGVRLLQRSLQQLPPKKGPLYNHCPALLLRLFYLLLLLLLFSLQLLLLLHRPRQLPLLSAILFPPLLLLLLFVLLLLLLLRLCLCISLGEAG